jgi:aerobic carbon-monoxide dehydrogenase medium subunit
VKPQAFKYEAPTSVADTLTLLSEYGEGAKVLAGGQSLVPMMSFRLARPDLLIDINRVEGLAHITRDEGELRIGTLVRHSALTRPVIEDPMGRLLATAGQHVGHLPIRERGTFGGSLVHADPAAEWCLLAATLSAQLVLQSVRGRRTVAAEEFFRSTFVTTIEPDELLVEVRIPLLGNNARVAFREFSRRVGDFAMVAVAVVVVLEGTTIRDARIGLGAVGGRPIRAHEAETLLRGAPVSSAAIREAAAVAARDADPTGDIHATAEHRRRVIEALTRRALDEALEQEEAGR